MKKLFSVLLAVALMATMAMSASAASTDLLGAAQNIYANDTNYATLTDNGDGSYTVVVTQDASADFSAAYGIAIEPFMTGVDLTATPYVNLKLTSDVPFRITLLDKNGAGEMKWIGFGNEFFNTVFPTGAEAPTSAPENAFFPAGDYDCAAFLKGYYDWKTNNDGLAGYDPANANITAFYIELQKAGTLTVSGLSLGTGEEGEEEAGGNDDAGTTTTKKQNSNNNSGKNPDTGEAENVALAVVALAAAAVVTITVVSKKAKSR